jgi:hypothetical protein
MIALVFCILSTIPDGSILFTENGSVVVANRTNSSLTHTAIVLDNYVYEARIPKVNKVPLAKYLKSKYKILITKPKKLYSKEELKRMKDFAESQLGREYSVRSFVKGYPKKSLHCSEYVSEILIQSKRYESTNPSRVTPGSLWESIKDDYTIEDKAQ